jgi:hypothetical protein
MIGFCIHIIVWYSSVCVCVCVCVYCLTLIIILCFNSIIDYRLSIIDYRLSIIGRCWKFAATHRQNIGVGIV